MTSDHITSAGARIVPPFTLETALRQSQSGGERLEQPRFRDRRARVHPRLDWRNRTEFFKGREAIKAFLRRKWEKELDYRLTKQLWRYTENRISVRLDSEWHDSNGPWYRAHGNEHWEFDGYGLMRRRDMSANDYAIEESQRRCC